MSNANANLIQLKNGASISAIEIKNATIKGIKQSLLVTEGASEHPISKILFDNCIIDGTAVNGYNFIQPDLRIVAEVAVKNSTIYNFDKGNHFILLQNKDAIDQAINVTVENNTIFNIGSQDNQAFVTVDNRYSSASSFTFKNNIMQDVRENPKAIFMFRSTNVAGAGITVLDNNLVVGVVSQSVKGAVLVTETNVKTLSGLAMAMLSFPNPTAGDFSFSKFSPLATAGIGGVELGDPRWLKATATFSPISFINAIDGQTITTLSPLEYREGSLTVLPTPVLDGYVFFGWSNSATIPGVIKSIPSTATGTQVFYAFWGEGGNNKPIVSTPTTYTISYLNLPKLVINPNAKTVSIGTAYELLEAQCRGYRFMGWYSDAAHLHEITAFDAAQSQNTSVYARWKKLEAFYAYPSVAKHSVTLKSSVENDTVNIVSATGIVLKQIKTNSFETEILVSDLPTGYYLIQSAKSGLTTKIIIK
ncbi:MAG: hypothetical protein B7Y83_11340 [Flavobacteriales bacterium 32-34-25]|nr:MAG: hypothetical protein B7Y83_11340 [Flavobacteriales bacterium 32-34-25]